MKRKHCSKCGKSGHNARTCPGGGARGGHSKGIKSHIDAIEKHTKALKRSLK